MKNINLLDTITDAKEAKEHGIDRHILWAYDYTQEAKLERFDIEYFGFSDGYDTIEENLNRFNITELKRSTTSIALMDNLTAYTSWLDSNLNRKNQLELQNNNRRKRN